MANDNSELLIKEHNTEYKIKQHPTHGLYLVTFYDKGIKQWQGLATCLTPAECHTEIKINERFLSRQNK